MSCNWLWLISIHSPYTGRDHIHLLYISSHHPFQSTLPIQGETGVAQSSFALLNISIHSPYTGRDNAGLKEDGIWGKFQSTLPIQGETFNVLSLERIYIFQSTLPIQGETLFYPFLSVAGDISIHSPYTGRDEGKNHRVYRKGISIHSPYTGRDASHPICTPDVPTFQSTLPIQGETCDAASIFFHLFYFNPLSLYRERQS